MVSSAGMEWWLRSRNANGGYKMIGQEGSDYPHVRAVKVHSAPRFPWHPPKALKHLGKAAGVGIWKREDQVKGVEQDKDT